MGGKSREHIPHTPAEKAELVKFLVDLGYVQYATPEFISKMDALGYDSIEDLPNLAQEDDYEELGMPEKHAEKIEEAALKELLRRFLAAIPEGSTAACTKLERHRPAGRPPLRAPGRSPACVCLCLVHRAASQTLRFANRCRHGEALGPLHRERLRRDRGSGGFG